MYKTTMCIYSLPTWLQKPRIELGFAGYEPTVLPLHYSAILLVEDVGAAPLLQLPKMVCYCYTTSSIPWYFISDLTAIPLYNFTRENFVKRKEGAVGCQPHICFRFTTIRKVCYSLSRRQYHDNTCGATRHAPL